MDEFLGGRVEVEGSTGRDTYILGKNPKQHIMYFSCTKAMHQHRRHILFHHHQRTTINIGYIVNANYCVLRN